MSVSAAERSSQAARPALDRPVLFLFLALALLPLAPLWWVSEFPSQDGPAHLEIAVVLRELVGSQATPFARYFAINPAPEPNWLVYPLLMAFDAAVAPGVAEKALVSIYLLSLPLAMLFAMRALRPAAAPIAFLGLPLALNYPLHMGFYNFAFGLAVFFVIVGCYARSSAPMTAAQTARLAALLLLAYFCHAVALAMALLAIGCSLLARAAAERSDGAIDWRRLLQVSLRVALAAAPSLLLLAQFVSSDNGPAPEPMTLATLARQLGVLYSLVSFDHAQVAVSAAMAATLGVAGAAVLAERWRAARPRRPGAGASHGFLLAAAATTALYFLAPAGLAGGGYLNQRLQLFIAFFALLWLASRPETDRWRGAAMTAGTLLAIASVVLHGVHYARIHGYLEEVRSAGAVLDPGSTLLPLSFDRRGAGPGRQLSRRVFPFEHAAGRLAAERGLIDLNSYQASRGYFPIVYRAECDPLVHLGTVEELSSEWPAARLDGYRDAPGCAVDYVLLWAADAEAHARNELLRDLARSFDRIFVSRRGLVEIYRRPPPA